MADNQIRTYTYTQNFVKYFNFVCMENSFIVYVFFLLSCSSLLLLLILLFVLIWCAY